MQTLTHHDILADRLQDHFLKDVLYQYESREVLKDELLELGQILDVKDKKGFPPYNTMFPNFV